MSFMQAEIAPLQKWVTATNMFGDTLQVPYDCWESFDEDGEPDNSESLFAESFSADAGKYEIEISQGFGARLSAPGYLDATDWCVFATEKAAEAYLVETYDLCPEDLHDHQEDAGPAYPDGKCPHCDADEVLFCDTNDCDFANCHRCYPKKDCTDHEKCREQGE